MRVVARVLGDAEEGTITRLDPQLFSRINDFVNELLRSECVAKYSPIEAAQWIEDYATGPAACHRRGYREHGEETGAGEIR